MLSVFETRVDSFFSRFAKAYKEQNYRQELRKVRDDRLPGDVKLSSKVVGKLHGMAKYYASSQRALQCIINSTHVPL